MKQDVPNLSLSLEKKIIAAGSNFKQSEVHFYWQMAVSFQCYIWFFWKLYKNVFDVEILWNSRDHQQL